MNLQYAHLLFGQSTVVIASSESTPIPRVFDFTSPEDCAKSIFALMGRAAGGFPIEACRIWVNTERRTATLVGRGVHVVYRDTSLPMLTAEEAMDMVQRKVGQTYHLGTVAPQ
ncbi:hypothetical protein HKW90_01885 [Pseudomonas aeruginosa]|uniref:hypothetical protein n=1 Tax=Pseudomonas nitroreducens TaxID=46680 RepID=UPI00351CEF87|nr:hypothetical protein [Pseudomonas aeruginosa]